MGNQYKSGTYKTSGGTMFHIDRPGQDRVTPPAFAALAKMAAELPRVKIEKATVKNEMFFTVVQVHGKWNLRRNGEVIFPSDYETARQAVEALEAYMPDAMLLVTRESVRVIL